MSRQIVHHPPAVAAADELGPDGISPLLWRIYRTRGVRSADEVSRELAGLIPPLQLDGVSDAVEILADAVDRRVLIVGDFDADGATSCALAVRVLRAFGYSDVDFLVPDRFVFGYGLSPEIVAHASNRNPDVIVTVDNGIASLEGVAAAKALGWRVIVTDHHLAGERLPEADALVNPNLRDSEFPSKAMAGVGVIFYVLLALRSHLRSIGWFQTRGISEPNLARYLDLVALGTVADVVPLDRNNRILVHQGLARIRAGRCCLGITILLQLARRNPARAQAGDMGFAVGPRLNAAGRLDDMSIGIRCLLSDDETEARELAVRLDRLNHERRAIEDDMKAQAEAMLAAWSIDADGRIPWGLCLYQADWHQGVIGILASRIKERYHRPVIVFADAGDGMLKGSARSIRGLHIRDALDELATGHPYLLQKFGGHAMAAGMTIKAQLFDEFARHFDAVVRRQLSEDDLQSRLLSDGAIPKDAMTLDTAREINAGGPWGQGFEEPLFDDRFTVVSQRIVGEKHWKLLLGTDDGAHIDAIAFNAVEAMPVLPSRIRAAYRLDENEWQGRVSLQLRVEYLEESE